MAYFIFNNKHYHLTNKNEVEKLFSLLEGNLKEILQKHNYPKDITLDKKNKLITHSGYSNIFITSDLKEYLASHPVWSQPNGIHAFIKLAYCALYYKNAEYPIYNFIFAPDKKIFQEAKKYTNKDKKNILERLSEHRISTEKLNKSTNILRFRRNGTVAGKFAFLQQMYIKNIKLLRFIFNKDENAPLKCASTGVNLENQFYNGFDQQIHYFKSNILDLHHVLVYRGKSVNKIENCDISKILYNKCLQKHQNKKYLIDFMGCIPLTPSQHRLCHRTLRNSDITCHTNIIMPYHLKSKVHYNKLANLFKINISYNEFLFNLTLDSIIN